MLASGSLGFVSIISAYLVRSAEIFLMFWAESVTHIPSGFAIATVFSSYAISSMSCRLSR